MTRLIGIDFGTTNSVVGVLQPDGRVTTQRYSVGRTQLDVFRTVLCFWLDDPKRLAPCARPLARRPWTLTWTIRWAAG